MARAPTNLTEPMEPTSTAVPASQQQPSGGTWRPGAGEERLAYCLLAPAFLLLALLIAYPFITSLYMSVTDRRIAMPGRFVGLQNFLELVREDEMFRQTLWNSVLYVVGAVGLKTLTGLVAALLLHGMARARPIFQAFLMLPWVVPASLSVLAWWWMYDPMSSVINWVLVNSGIVSRPIPWLSDPFWARSAIIITNVWRGLPFFALCFLAGLVSIPRDYYEAAETDGAGAIASFWRITLPLLRPMLGIVVLYSVVMTIADFEIVYILTRGGPRNSTHLLGTLAYQVGLTGGRLGEAAAISLFIFPVLVVVSYFMLRAVRHGTEVG
jgi:multiple sugar transport system permease protein